MKYATIILLSTLCAACAAPQAPAATTYDALPPGSVELELHPREAKRTRQVVKNPKIPAALSYQERKAMLAEPMPSF